MPRTSVQRLLPCHILTLLKCLSRMKVFFIFPLNKKCIQQNERIFIYIQWVNIKIVGPQRQSRWNDDDFIRDLENLRMLLSKM